MIRPKRESEGLLAMQKDRNVVSARDVVAEIMRVAGPMTSMKLQKLTYYSQAWSLVWDDLPLFSEKIEAWANGPIVPELYAIHRGMFEIKEWTCGNPDLLKPYQKETIEAVVKYYGVRSGQWLSELTHQESPWKDARQGLAPGERGDNEITLESMSMYYGSL